MSMFPSTSPSISSEPSGKGVGKGGKGGKGQGGIGKVRCVSIIFFANDILCSYLLDTHILIHTLYIFKPSVCTFLRQHSAVRVVRAVMAVSPPTFSSDSVKSAPLNIPGRRRARQPKKRSLRSSDTTTQRFPRKELVRPAIPVLSPPPIAGLPMFVVMVYSSMPSSANPAICSTLPRNNASSGTVGLYVGMIPKLTSPLLTASLPP